MQRAGLLAAAEAARWTSSSAPAWTCCAPRPRTPRVAASDAPALLLRAAKALEPLDPAARARDVSRRLELGAVRREAGERQRACRRSLARAPSAPRRPTLPRPSDLLLDGFAHGVHRRAAPRRRRSSSRPRRAASRASDVSVEEVLRWGWLATAAAVMVWDYDTCVAVAERGVELARDGRRADRAGGQRQRAGPGRRAGRGLRAGGDCSSVRPTASPRPRAPGSRRTARSCSPAFRAARPTRPSSDRRHDRGATAGGQGTAVQYAHWARSILLNGLGRYREAIVAAASEASDDTPELFVSVWAAIGADRGRGQERRARRSRTMHSSASLAATAVARHRLGASASRRARARC